MNLSLELSIFELKVDCDTVLSSLSPDNKDLVGSECISNNAIKFTVSKIKPSSLYSLPEELINSVEEVEKLAGNYS